MPRHFRFTLLAALLLIFLALGAYRLLYHAERPVAAMPAATPEIISSDGHYFVDWPSIVQHFPADFPAPPLLRRFAEWVVQYPASSVGRFSVIGDRMGDRWIEDGFDLAERFPAFLHLPNGSTVGYWRREDGRAPVVLNGAEGELAVLADDLPEFLNLLARASSPAHWTRLPSELTRDPDEPDPEDPTDNRPQLTQWLQQQKLWMSDAELAQRAAARDATAKAIGNKTAITSNEESSNPLQDFLRQQWQPARVAARQNNRELRELFQLLKPYRPKPKSEAWEHNSMEVVWIGEQMTLSRFRQDGQPLALPEAARARTLLGALREASRAANPARGVWQSATLELYADKAVLIRNYLDRPNPRLHGFTDAELLADLVVQNRSAYWSGVLEAALQNPPN